MLIESWSKLRPDQALHFAVNLIAVGLCRSLYRGETEEDKPARVACHTD